MEKEQRWLPVLAPQLPLPIPAPVARGEPGEGYPFPWSVYRWLEGEPAATAELSDLTGFAVALAGFLSELERVDATGGPEPGEHNFFRGGPLGTYEGETLQAIEKLGDTIPRDDVLRVWEDAMSTSWDREPVWVHGDVAVGNLLVRDGRLAAVLDFGSSGVGDPACDMVIAWTFLSGESRGRFRAELGVDHGHVVARPRLGAVEGVDHHARRGGPPRHRAGHRGLASARVRLSKALPQPPSWERTAASSHRPL